MKLQIFVGFVIIILFLYVYYNFSCIEGFYETTTKAMIIIEPRKHPLLKKVIENFDKHMDSSWDLYVFHGLSFEDYAKECTSNILSRKVILKQLDYDNMSATDYNTLFKKKHFWNKIDAEDILVFQTDSVLCGGSSKTINEYIKYDYIGCSYDNKVIGEKMFRHWSPQYHFYGIGGLSFRKKSFMIQCIYDNPDVPNDFPEDMFFSQCVAKSSKRPSSAKVLNQFCTQFVFKEESWGAHKTNVDLQNRDEFYEYCPEARMLENS
jgi:hypothetical protein